MNNESLQWSAQYTVAPNSPATQRLKGDKIILPQSALEGLLAAAPVVTIQNTSSHAFTPSFDPYNPYSFAAESRARDALADRQQQLPHPLTFKLVNPRNGRIVYAGIREFSADDGQIGLSQMLQKALRSPATSRNTTRSNTPDSDIEMSGVDTDSLRITVHHHNVPKGTYVKLRPLASGYDPEDWKSLLEHYLRDNYTTLTIGEILTVGAGKSETFDFLVDEIVPSGDAICIIDTDLEVDIEPLSEEQAKESLEKKLAKSRKTVLGSKGGSSNGGVVLLNQAVEAQVIPGEYVDFTLQQWDKKADLEISVSTDDGTEVDILVSPFSNYSRALPRLDNHMFSSLNAGPDKIVRLSKTNVNLEEAQQINIAVHVWKQPEDEDLSSAKPVPFVLKCSGSNTVADLASGGHSKTSEVGPDEVVCKNCTQHIPKRTLALHEAFCYRNNVRCPTCGNVFLKNSDVWKAHWHCPYDEAYGDNAHSKLKHDALIHPSATLHCPGCEFQAFNIPILAQHRTADCPAKEILCQFCHLLVPQQGPDDPSRTNAEVLMSGMTPHEYADGARTTECHLCNRIVRLRDMRTHLRIHDRDRVARAAPTMCSNGICRRAIKAGDEHRVLQEQLGLCNECFGPLYITSHDPDGKMLRRRVERRLLQQLMSGCAKPWCHNAEWCKTGYKHSTGEDRILSAKESLPKVKPVLDQITRGDYSGVRFCVGEAVQSRLAMAEMIAAENIYELAWCVRALEEEQNDISKARGWLTDRAPKILEVAN